MRKRSARPAIHGEVSWCRDHTKESLPDSLRVDCGLMARLIEPISPPLTRKCAPLIMGNLFLRSRSIISVLKIMANSRKVAAPRVVNIADLRPLAERRLPRAVFDYLDGG